MKMGMLLYHILQELTGLVPQSLLNLWYHWLPKYQKKTQLKSKKRKILSQISIKHLFTT